MCKLPGKRSVGRSGHHMVDNVERNASDLGLEETRTERPIDRIGWRGVVFEALGSRGHCGM